MMATAKPIFAIRRPTDGTWHVRTSSTGYTGGFSKSWGGQSTDIPVVADYDGDGRADIAIRRPTDCSWWVLTSSSDYTEELTKPWSHWGGQSTDIPVVGDYDGDGRADPAIRRPTDKSWHVLMSSSGYETGISTVWAGQSTDIPVIGDFDGDGCNDLAVRRPTDGTWQVLQSTSEFNESYSQSWGNSADVPVVADFNGNGRTDFATWCPADGSWHVVASDLAAPESLRRSESAETPAGTSPGHRLGRQCRRRILPSCD